MAQEKAPKDRRPFVDLPKSDDDKANLIVSREPFTFILMNRYPYNAGHLLVLPYREVADIEDLNKDERSCFLESTIKAKRLLTAAIKPDGFNIGVNLGEAGGAGIPKHLHLHVVPRWNGDTNFMPAIGQTNVLPEALAETAAKLRTALAPA